MQEIETFMQALFRERAAEERAILVNRVEYRQKFFDPDCLWDSRKHDLEMIESERIVSTDVSGLSVITEDYAPWSKTGMQVRRRRYLLRAEGSGLRIRDVEEECPMCDGHGGETCPFCKGKHFLSANQLLGG